MLKNSDNLIADTLFKNLGAISFSQQGTWMNGATAVKIILSRYLQANLGRLMLVDGSGLSRDNLLTPAQLSALLYASYHHSISRDFISSLPLAGVDGTLRAIGPPFNKTLLARMQAKTGSMSGVMALKAIYTPSITSVYL
jgi:serine-type D-Ala-D-Ala carboxypeptidase/endopeptidase (penicillin-binding protein 4)